MKTWSLAVALVLSFAPASIGAQTVDRAATVRGLFGATPATGAANFSDAFLAAVPYARVRAVTSDLTARLGEVATIAPLGNDEAIAFTHGSVIATIHLDVAGKIDGLLFHDERSPADEAALTKFLTATKVDPALFSPSARALVKSGEIETVRAGLAAGGKFRGIVETPYGYLARYEHSESRVTIATDTDGRITLIFFKPPVPLAP